MKLSAEYQEVKEEHLKLLRRTYIFWNEEAYDGAPAVSLKRPYGNSSPYDDIAEIIGIEYDPEDGLQDDDLKKVAMLHREMENVMQILVHNLGISVGVYTRSYIGAPWTRKES